MPKVPDFWEDFRQFAFKDNLVSLATGVVIGTAFKNVSGSFVEDIIAPLLGLILGRVEFTDMYLVLSRQEFADLEAAQAAGVPILRYGEFLTVLIDFLLTAVSIYLVLRWLFRWKPEEKK